MHVFIRLIFLPANKMRPICSPKLFQHGRSTKAFICLFKYFNCVTFLIPRELKLKEYSGSHFHKDIYFVLLSNDLMLCESFMK